MTIEAGADTPPSRYEELAASFASVMHRQLSIRPKVTVVEAGTRLGVFAREPDQCRTRQTR